MKLRRIEIVGFKSFRTRMGVEIGDGVTAVVGPNGCGKSNIVDAIRWAMGSQSPRDLRGKAMEDIIFGGSEHHRPMGFAEVSLTFSNDPSRSILPLEWRDQDQIKVTRRLFRNGDSDYEINGARARLRDVHNVFAGTGVSSRDAYSIIEQGRIGFVVNARPEERRVIIEEAAGITRYKKQRKLAERRLRKTEDNLLRIGDVVREVGAQVARLKRQAERAAAARELHEELRLIDMLIHAGTLRRTDAAYQTAMKDHRNVEENSQAAQMQIAAAEATYEAARLDAQTREHAAKEAAEAVYRTRTRLELLRANIEHRAREQATSRERRDEALQQQSANQKTYISLGEELEQLRASQSTEQASDDGRDAELQSVEQRREEIRQQAEQADDRMARARRALSECERTLARASTREDALRADLRALVQREQTASKDREQAANLAIINRQQAGAQRDDLSALEQKQHDVQQALGAQKDEERSARTRLDGATNALQNQEDAARKTRAELASIEQVLASGAGLAPGARKVLSAAQKAGLDGISGAIATRWRVREGFEARLGAILGVWMDAVVVRDTNAALQLLECAERSGESITVVCLENSVVGPIVDWLEATEPIPGILADMIRRTELRERLNANADAPSVDARRFWSDGQGRFAFRSDAMAAEQLLQTRRERERLVQAVNAADAASQEARDALQYARMELDAAQRARAGLVESAEQCAEATRAARANLEEQLLRAQRAERERRRIDTEHKEAKTRAQRVQTDLDQCQQESRAAEEERDALIKAHADAQAEHQAHAARREKIEEHWTTLKIEKARRDADKQHLEDKIQRLERERAAAQKRLEQAKARQAQLEHTARVAKEAAAHDDKELLRLKEASIQAERAADTTRTASDSSRARARELEAELASHRRANASMERDVQAAMLAVERARNDRQRAVEHTRTHFGRSPEALLDDIGDRRSTDETLRDRERLTRRLDALGAVNPAAEEEFAAAAQRKTFLDEQLEDLQTAMHDLRAAISRMDETCRVLFEQTFTRINAGFQRMFPRLFRGGNAHLGLSDPSDLLSTGVEIIAQPPGKRLQNLSLLSGGEKALTAVALIFAIFELRPSPICIMDEVDAPLDEANVGRFAEMVREISAQSQFLVITHNTRTMEVADTLYGVTMQEPGVSKLVGVSLKAVRGKASRTAGEHR